MKFPFYCIAASFGLIATLAATPLASDPFDTAAGGYTAGAQNLIGQGPANSGFTGNWLAAFGGAQSPDVSATGLSFAGITTSGGAVSYPGNGGGRCGRLLAQSYDDSSTGTIYIGVMMQLEFIGSGYRAFEMHNGGFDDGGNRVLQIATGESGGGVVGANDWALRMNNNDALVAGLGAQDTVVDFFVLRIDFSAAAVSDAITLYRNPADLAVEGNNTGIGLSGFDLRFDRLSFARFGNDGLSFDEIRVGTTFNDVTETTNPDADGDGMDDGWELANGLDITLDDSLGDAAFDNDGLTNLQEFIAGTDPNLPDTDADGINDADELDGSGNAFDAMVTNAVVADSDGDGILDGTEVSSGNGFITNPNNADTDGDAENDAIEIAAGTDPLDGTSNSAALGNFLVDGLRDSLYGSPIAVQTVETGFGDNQSELNAGYAAVANGRLHILLTGNLEANFNKLHVFIDTGSGGSQTFTSATNDGAGRMDGLVFDADFSPRYHLIIRRGTDGGGEKVDLDFADLDTGEFVFYERVFGTSLAGRAETGAATTSTFATAPAAIGIGYDNANTAGVGGTAGNAADTTAAEAVSTGLELAVDLSALGLPSGTVKIAPFVTSADHSFASNQFLGGLPVGTGNLGEPLGLDLSTFAGDQYFSIDAPLAEPRIVDILIHPEIGEVTVVWESVPGATYTIEFSTDLRTWTEFDDTYSAGPGATTSLSTAAGFGPGSRLFVRLSAN